MSPRVFVREIRGMELPFTKMGKLQEGHVFGKDQEFSFEHVTFEMVVRQRQTFKDITYAVVYTSLKCGGKGLGWRPLGLDGI